MASTNRVYKIIFPGGGRITSYTLACKTIVIADYDMNLEQYMQRKGKKIENETFYKIRNVIDSWRETKARDISFINRAEHIFFSLHRVSGSKMFYGREEMKERLAWSECAYSIQAGKQKFEYDIGIGKNG